MIERVRVKKGTKEPNQQKESHTIHLFEQIRNTSHVTLNVMNR